MKINRLSVLLSITGFCLVLNLGCGGDDSSSSDVDGMPMAGAAASDDPHNLGDSYHDYRSCKEQKENPKESQEPASPGRMEDTVSDSVGRG